MSTNEVAQMLADLQKRVRNIERANSLQRSSIRDEHGETIPVVPAIVSAAGALANALTSRLNRAVNDGLVNIFYGEDTPENPDEGDLWLVDDITLRRYESGAWVLSVDQALTEVIANAQNTADSKTQTFWQPTAPALGDPIPPAEGDLWFRTEEQIDPGQPPVILDMWRWNNDQWVQLPLGSMQTPAYSEGNSGVKIDTEVTQFENVNVLGELGAAKVTAESLTLNDLDLATVIDALPRGALTYARSYGTHSGDIADTETIIFEFNGGALKTGRIYRIHAHGHIDGAVNSAWDLRLRYKTDGTTPTTSSSILDGSLTRVDLASNGDSAFSVMCYYVPGADYETSKFSLTMMRTGGTGTARVYLSDVNRATEFIIEDLGLFAGSVASGGNGVLTQRSKATGGTVETDPVQTYTRTWYATWSRSYDSDNGTRTGDDTSDMYQGYISGTHGNTRSLCGFDYADIQSKLAGATITSIKVTYRVRHAWANAGITVYVNSHDYTAKPSTYDEGRVNQDRDHWSGQKAGSTYTHTLPVAVGNEFKSGTTRGLGFGPAPSNSSSAYYGYMYGGSSSSSRPRITITYRK